MLPGDGSKCSMRDCLKAPAGVNARRLHAPPANADRVNEGSEEGGALARHAVERLVRRRAPLHDDGGREPAAAHVRGGVERTAVVGQVFEHAPKEAVAMLCVSGEWDIPLASA